MHACVCLSKYAMIRKIENFHLFYKPYLVKNHSKSRFCKATTLGKGKFKI